MSDDVIITEEYVNELRETMYIYLDEVTVALMEEDNIPYDQAANIVLQSVIGALSTYSIENFEDPTHLVKQLQELFVQQYNSVKNPTLKDMVCRGNA